MTATVLKEIIEDVAFTNPMIAQGYEFGRLENAWGQIVGPGLADQCRPEQLKQGVLWVSTAHPGWAQQMHFYQKKLCLNVNAFFKKNVVKELRYTSGKVEDRRQKIEVRSQKLEAATITTGEPSAYRLEPTALSLQPVAHTEVFEDVPDETLRERMVTLWSKAQAFFSRERIEMKTCSACGALYRGTHPILCLACEGAARAQKRQVVEKLIKDAPWTNYKDAPKNVRSVGESLFHEIKSEVLRRTSDVLRRELFAYLGHPSKPGAEALKAIILRYVQLRTGLTPAQINGKIIEQTVGVRRFRLLKQKGVLFPGG